MIRYLNFFIHSMLKYNISLIRHNGINKMKENTLRKLEYIAAIIIYGTIGCFTKFIDLPSSIIVLSRGIIGSLFILLFMLIKREKINFSSIKQNIIPLLFGGISLGFNWIFLFSAYTKTSVANAILLNYLAPVMFILLAWIIFKEKMKAYKIICIIISLIGMAMICGVFEGGLSINLQGLIYGLLAACFYVLLLVFNKKLNSVDSLNRTLVQLLAATFVMLPYALIKEDIFSLSFSSKNIIFLIILGIVHTGLAYLLYLGSMAWLRAQTIAIYSYIEPVLSVLLSYFILKEDMSIMGFIGGGLILSGTLLSEIIHIYIANHNNKHDNKQI